MIKGVLPVVMLLLELYNKLHMDICSVALDICSFQRLGKPVLSRNLPELKQGIHKDRSMFGNGMP